MVEKTEGVVPDRPLWCKWPSSLVQDRPVLDGTYTLARPSTLRTVHFHPFGPSTLDLTHWYIIITHIWLTAHILHEVFGIFLLYFNIIWIADWRRQDRYETTFSRFSNLDHFKFFQNENLKTNLTTTNANSIPI